MELDDLKAGWKRSVGNIQKPSADIKSLLTSKGTGLVSELRDRFRRGMIIVPIVIAIALSRLPHHHGFVFYLCFAFLLVFGLSMVGYFYFNYRLLGRVQAMDASVKENLQKEVRALEKGVRLRLVFMRGMALLFILMIEGLIHFGEELSEWNAEPFTVRLMLYVVAFAAFYLLTHLAVKHRYSRKISHLKELVNELE
jgi:drug/metabolite transporter (DMT)-like permease